MEILPSAHNHGSSDDDIRHAFTNVIASISTTDEPDFCLMVGPDQAGHPPEVGVLAADGND